MAHERPRRTTAKWAEKPTEKSPTIVATGSGRMPYGKSHRESADDYCRVIAVFDHRYRLIDGACGLQWVLQKRDGKTRSGTARWTGVRYLRTRNAVFGLYRSLCAPCDGETWQLLEQLPERHPKWGKRKTRPEEGQDNV